MYRIEKSFRFEASHILPKHDGKCARLHGHGWVGKVVLEDYELITTGPKAGMLMDYGDISNALSGMIENYLDHQHLNETTGLSNPTSERLAKWIFDFLKDKIPAMVCVRIEETCTSAAEYWYDRKVGA